MYMIVTQNSEYIYSIKSALLTLEEAAQSPDQVWRNPSRIITTAEKTRLIRVFNLPKKGPMSLKILEIKNERKLLCAPSA